MLLVRVPNPACLWLGLMESEVPPYAEAALVWMRRDASAWHEITPYDGGISGWQLLWDRWCPIPSLRYAPQSTRTSSSVQS